MVGFPGYSVSDHGRVRNDRTARILRDGAHRYARVSLRRDGGSWVLTVHPLVLEAFAGPRPSPGAHGLHDDDDGRHNHTGNLRWGTALENAADARRNGRQRRQAPRCPYGHGREPANRTPRGGCLACNRTRSIVRNGARRGVQLDHQAISDQHYADIMAGVEHPHARARTHCPRDHQLAAPNVIAAFAQAGRRGCLACHRARGYVAHHRGADLDVVADRYYAEIMAAA